MQAVGLRRQVSQAARLRWRALGGATVGDLAVLVDRAISAADAIGKTADKIEVGIETLRELRFAAKAFGN